VGCLSAGLELSILFKVLPLLCVTDPVYPRLCANCQKRNDSALRDSGSLGRGKRRVDLEDAELARTIINLVNEPRFEL
jgi:hypothetical protein